MSKIKNAGLEQCGVEPFEQQQFGSAGVERVNATVKFTVAYAIVDFVVQCRGRRRIHHVPVKRDVIDCNNFAS